MGCCKVCCGANSIFSPIQFEIGDGKEGTPVNGSNMYVNGNLKFVPYLVSKNGFGNLLENKHYERLPNGGFKLLAGAVFGNEEIYTITGY